MRRLSLPVAAVLGAALLGGGGSRAQGQGSAPTTVQLPTFHVFTVQTTVSVPDRGGLGLGGITRGSDGRVQLGPLGNRSSSSGRGAGGVSATATIIDNRELDDVVLDAAARTPAGGQAPGKSAALVREISKGAAQASAPGSLAAVYEQNAAADEQRNVELEAWLSKGQQAAARGQPGLAKTYYRMVAKRASGGLKQQAEGLLAGLATGKAANMAQR